MSRSLHDATGAASDEFLDMVARLAEAPATMPEGLAQVSIETILIQRQALAASILELFPTYKRPRWQQATATAPKER